MLPASEAGTGKPDEHHLEKISDFLQAGGKISGSTQEITGNTGNLKTEYKGETVILRFPLQFIILYTHSEHYPGSASQPPHSTTVNPFLAGASSSCSGISCRLSVG